MVGYIGLRRVGSRGGGVQALDLTDLFASDEDGGLYGLPYEPGVDLYVERTSPATLAGVGDPVGTVIDKSGNGRHLVAPSDAARPTLAVDARGFHYLSFDGVNDAHTSASTYSVGEQYLLCAIENNDALYTLATAQDNNNHHRIQTSVSSGGFSYSRFGASTQSISNIDTIGFLSSTPPGEFAIISSMLRKNYLDNSANSGTKSFKVTTWDETAITNCYIGRASISTVKDYGSMVLKRDVGDVERAEIEARVAAFYRHPIIPREFDLFIIGGQSNAIGRALADGDSPVARTYQAAVGGGVVAPTVPLNHPDDDAGDVGPDIAFATAYLAQYPSRNLLFVPVAYGGTRFSNGGWRKSGAHYNRLVLEANNAIAANSGATLKGLIMALGENDTIAGPFDTVQFVADMDQFISDVRADITGASSMPVVWAGMAGDWVDSNAKYRAYQNAIADIGNRVSNAAYADSESPTKAPSVEGDIVHFDRSGVYTMGARWYEAWEVARAE